MVGQCPARAATDLVCSAELRFHEPMANHALINAVHLPRVAPLAIAALLVSLIPLCPPLNMVGVVLGLFALRQVSRAGGSLRGRGAANTAILVGLVVGAASWWAWSDTLRWMDQAIGAQTAVVSDAFFTEIVKPDAASSTILSDLWSGGTPPDAEALSAFGAALRSAGPVVRVQVEPPQSVQGLSGDMQAWVLLETPSNPDPLIGGVVVSVTLIPHLDVRLKSVTVHLTKEHSITLPPDAEAAKAGDSDAPSEDPGDGGGGEDGA